MDTSPADASSVTEEFTYNGRNQLTSYNTESTSATYTYGANGLRMSKTVDSTESGFSETGFIWNGQNLVAETDGFMTQSIYSYGADGIQYGKINGREVFYVKDAHGNTVLTLNETKGGIRDYAYDAFGNQQSVVDSSDTNPFRYCGEYYDSESGNIYLRARYYDSANGRFISEDPIKDGLNWYSYCSGNPVMFVDPSGCIGFFSDGSIYMSDNDTEIDYQLLQCKIRYEYAYTEEEKQAIGMQAQKLRDDNPSMYHVDKDKPLDYYAIYDVTDSLTNYMRNNVWKYEYLRNASSKEKLKTFYELVKNGAKMDLKNQPEWQHEHYVFYGEVIDKDAPGNINYGYFGAGIGFSNLTLEGGAGYAQIRAGTSSFEYILNFGDDPRDQLRIKQGISLYYNDPWMQYPQPGPAPQ